MSSSTKIVGDEEIWIDENWRQVNSEGGPTLVYHGTGPDFAESIKDNGLIRGREWENRPPSVYFSSNEQSAHDYANVMGRLGNKYSIVEFEIPKSFDPSVIFDDADFMAFGKKHSFRLERDVPVSWIKSIKVFDTYLGTVVELIKSLRIDEVPNMGYVPVIIVDDKDEE